MWELLPQNLQVFLAGLQPVHLLFSKMKLVAAKPEGGHTELCMSKGRITLRQGNGALRKSTDDLELKAFGNLSGNQSHRLL